MNARGPDIDEYETPDWFYNSLDTEFGFTLDPCASETTYKCSQFCTKKENGLSTSWGGHRVFMNPPYSDHEDACKSDCKKMRCSKRGWHREVENPGLESWVTAGVMAWGYGGALLVVMLLPARTAADWFQLVQKNAEIRFYRKRIAFLLDGVELKSPRFDSMLAILRGPRL